MKYLLLAVILAIASMGAYDAFSPAVAHKRAVKHLLQDIQEAVATKDRQKIAAALEKAFAPGAHITLNVGFAQLSVLPQEDGMKQQFTRGAFIRFIDLTLQPLTDYGVVGTELDALGSEDQAQISMTAFGEGNSTLLSSSTLARYIAETACTAQISFPEKHTAQIESADCDVTLRILPQGNAQTMRNLQDTLKRYQ